MRALWRLPHPGEKTVGPFPPPDRGAAKPPTKLLRCRCWMLGDTQWCRAVPVSATRLAPCRELLRPPSQNLRIAPSEKARYQAPQSSQSKPDSLISRKTPELSTAGVGRRPLQPQTSQRSSTGCRDVT